MSLHTFTPPNSSGGICWGKGRRIMSVKQPPMFRICNYPAGIPALVAFAVVALSAIDKHMLATRGAYVPLLATLQETESAKSINVGPQTHSRPRVNPKYCIKPEQIMQRSIPAISGIPNNDNHGTVSTQILQVFSIIRHGARAPDKPDTTCWRNFSGYGLGCRLRETAFLL